MPAYNFKRCFVHDVVTGRKSMTIRPLRKRATKPGDTLYLYTGMRSKSCQLLRKEECLRVTPVRITARTVTLGTCQQYKSEIDRLALLDGFSCKAEFFEFYRKQCKFPFKGEMIEWEAIVPVTWNTGDR
ncbi:MAG: hypothetical protein GY862_37595 [Gammaproteobacteria bacterium]|nr:hypothetical protein [Gammaproteobacteria bacterium]